MSDAPKRRYRRYHFDTMQPGTSRMIPLDGYTPDQLQSMVASAAGRYSKRAGGWFITRRSTIGVRVTRVA
jgi:hypothetical protein